MAEKKDIDFSYTTMDKIWRLSIGEMADFTGARYDGDFSMRLEDAQLKKHQFISDNLHITNESRVLDMGCGWGPFLNHLSQIGAKGIGVTLSQGQYAACRKNGFDVYIKDCRSITPDDFGSFDAVASVGAFEHFCSVEDFQHGKQDDVYQHLFKTISDLLPIGGRCFIQTMAFGDDMIPFEAIDINADKDSNAYLMALIVNEFPGSWLPYGHDHVVRSAEPHFKLVHSHSGKDDYIETIKVWRKKLKSFGIQKYMAYLSLAPRLLYDVRMRNRYQNLKIAPIKVAFERGIWDHFRYVFEKVS
jgi:cyclopropane-fatty-acyl-phospholipid synthase